MNDLQLVLLGSAIGAIAAIVGGIIGGWVQGRAWYHYERRRAKEEKRQQWIETALEWVSSGQRESLRRADLQGADLRGVALQKADLSYSDLQGSDLRGAYLSGADLQGANMQGANLSDAHLDEANLQGADLRGADLLRSTLTSADLRYSDLRAANLSFADVCSADLTDANIEKARSLPTFGLLASMSAMMFLAFYYTLYLSASEQYSLRSMNDFDDYFFTVTIIMIGIGSVFVWSYGWRWVNKVDKNSIFELLLASIMVFLFVWGMFMQLGFWLSLILGITIPVADVVNVANIYFAVPIFLWLVFLTWVSNKETRHQRATGEAATFRHAILGGVQYDSTTVWPEDFIPPLDAVRKET